jgi:probable DNA metabolism protein
VRIIKLDSDIDLDGFRRAGRLLLAENVAPEQVEWQIGAQGSGSLFEADSSDSSDGGASVDNRTDAPQEAAAVDGEAPGKPAVSVPRSFLTLCESVALHSDHDRYALLYGLLWRIVHEPEFRHDTLDPAMTRARLMSQQVRRDMHKMTAFVRFREVHDIVKDGLATEPGGQPLHVAWFEPDHHIVEATAPFFVRRFTSMKWAILTPERSVRWDGEELQFGPGGTADQAPPPDANEALWLTYYQHIFNPARLKVDAMQKEMPRKYWRNLPEAQLIAPMIARAEVRSEQMVAQGGSEPARRVPSRARPEPSIETPDVEGRSALPPDSGKDSEPAGALSTLKHAASSCRECPIGEHATQVVWGEGRPHARLMVVGEQPGDQEDLQGRPFVGPSGALFDRAVADLGWSRKAFYVTNAVKHFKFEVRGKRRIHKTPSQREAAICGHWLESEIEAVQPQAMIALGGTAARSLMGRAVGVMSERGKWLTRDDGRQVLITLHPSALLRLHDSERDAAYAQWLDDLSKAADIATLDSDK